MYLYDFIFVWRVSVLKSLVINIDKWYPLWFYNVSLKIIKSYYRIFSIVVISVILLIHYPREGTHGAVINCDKVVSEFEFQSRYNVHFQTNRLEKAKTFRISPSYEVNSNHYCSSTGMPLALDNTWKLI